MDRDLIIDALFKSYQNREVGDQNLKQTWNGVGKNQRRGSREYTGMSCVFHPSTTKIHANVVFQGEMWRTMKDKNIVGAIDTTKNHNC